MFKLRIHERQVYEEKLDEINELLNAGKDIITELERKLAEKETALQEAYQIRDSLARDLSEAKKLIREQTKADILLNALEACGIAGFPKTSGVHLEQDRQLRAQMEALSRLGRCDSNPGPVAGIQSLFGGGIR